MTNILFVTSSLMGLGSKSREIAAEVVARLRRSHPRATLTERHLTPQNMPHLTMDTLSALSAPEERRTPRQRELAAFADGLIEEVEAADAVVIAAPMYNFSLPTVLKAWLDHIARAGRTFRYTADGPEGLLKNKKIYVVASRGGYYSGDSPARALDFQEPYLRAFLGFLGITDVAFIHVEGLNVSPEAAAAGLDNARHAVDGLFLRQAA